MIDAMVSASRSQRGTSIQARTARSARLGRAASTVALAPWLHLRGPAGVTVAVRF